MAAAGRAARHGTALMKLAITVDEAAKLERARALLDELNAMIAARDIPVEFGITAACGGMFGGAEGELVPVIAKSGEV